MDINVSVKLDAGELAGAINNLAVAVTSMLAARAEARAETVAEKTIEKASAKSKPVAAKTPTPTPAQDIDKAEVQKLAQAKSKTSGAVAVKECIAKFGGTQINTTPPEKLVELKAALEALA